MPDAGAGGAILASEVESFAYATFIGNQQVHRDSPTTFPSGPGFREYFKLMLKTLIPRERPAAAPSSLRLSPSAASEARVAGLHALELVQMTIDGRIGTELAG